MGNETRWYSTREQVKLLGQIDGVQFDAALDQHIEAASQAVEELTNRRFIPLTATKSYPWPQAGVNVYSLELDEDLLAVTSLTKEGDDVAAISSSDYFLEPNNLGPPYFWIEIDRSSTEYFGSKDTPQRAIRVTGRWGYSESTRAAGTVSSGLASDASATSMVCSDASKIGVGDTMLIESEAIFVSAKAASDTTANLNGALTASKNETTVTVDDATQIKVGEVILVDAERMLVESISGNDLTVQRAYDGTTLAAHSGGTEDVYAFRSLTIVRGVNGTTGATHANSTAISVYAPPAEIVRLVRAEVLAAFRLDRGGWTGQIGSGENVIEGRNAALTKLREQARSHYKRRAYGAVGAQ